MLPLAGLNRTNEKYLLALNNQRICNVIVLRKANTLIRILIILDAYVCQRQCIV